MMINDYKIEYLNANFPKESEAYVLQMVWNEVPTVKGLVDVWEDKTTHQLLCETLLMISLEYEIIPEACAKETIQ